MSEDLVKRKKTRALAIGVSVVISAAATAASPTADQLRFFETNIRPILIERCYKCHSSKAKKLQAGLHLDSHAGILRGGETGPAIVPGDIDNSLLIKAIRYTSDEIEMPPKSKLSDAEIKDFEAWVKMGAPWPKEAAPESASAKVEEFDFSKRMAEHWAWKPIGHAPDPPVNNNAWARNSIDKFILAALEAKGLAPSPATDRRTWLRRVTFDLIGLPPTRQEINEFLGDTSLGAYETVVDRLLASPHFGERWARHWMDLTRYAESFGHEFDYTIANAYRYRDYLVRAFNGDVPYSRLITEHIAGDLIAEPRLHPTDKTNESIMGTTFWFIHEATHAPTDVQLDEADRIDNQLTVMSHTFLGVSVGCARCHDHKFDPIPTSDYYAMSGFLKSSRRQEAMLDPVGKIAEAAKQLRDLKAKGDRMLVGSAKQAVLNGERFGKYLRAAHEVFVTKGEAPDASDVVIATVTRNHNLDAETLSRWVKATNDPQLKNDSTHPLHAWAMLASAKDAASFTRTKADLLEKMSDRRAQSLPADAEGPRPLGNFDSGELDGWFITGEAFKTVPTRTEWDPTTDGLADFGTLHGGLFACNLHGVLRSPTFTLDKEVHLRIKASGVQLRLIIEGYQMEPFSGLLFTGTNIKSLDTKGEFQWISMTSGLHLGTRAYVEIIDHGNGYAILDEAWVNGQGEPAPSSAAPPAELMRAISTASSGSDSGFAESLGEFWSTALKRWAATTTSVTDQTLIAWALRHDLIRADTNGLGSIKKQMEQVERSIPKPQLVFAMTEGTVENDHIHIRGSHKHLGVEAPRRLVQALGGTEQAQIKSGSGRRELALRIIDPANPLTRRVAVNRIWHHLFGRGIVASVDDFGKMGTPPSHPKLLDYLANEFDKNGWSIKKMIRSIVLSNTYRMSSKPWADQALVAKTDSTNVLLHRMPIRRLQAEAIRDQILAISGRLDRTVGGPSVPVALTKYQDGRGKPPSGPLDGGGRRSLYLAVRRNFLSSMMLAYDFPVPFTTIGRRTTSNVPAQALAMLNDPFVVAEANRWGEAVSRQSGSPRERVTAMFEAAFAQKPTDKQLAKIELFLAGRNDATAWAEVAHTLFNMKQFILAI